MLIAVIPAQAQNRGVYPLGMSAINSGITPAPGFSYSNQFLLYSRDEAKDDNGNTIATGTNSVIMDMNTLTWVSNETFLGGARYSASATFPFAKNDLTSDIHGNISGGSGFADSYYLPLIFGWTKERIAVRFMYGFLAPTGRFAAEANDNVGSGYWTHTLSSGQTCYLTRNQRLVFSAFQMYEFHTTQEGTGIHPGDTFELDDIQSAVLRPRPTPYQATYVIFRIDDRKAGRELMRRLSSVVASAAHPTSPAGDTWVSAALSFQGLKALGVPRASLQSFPLEFQHGMAARAKILGDNGESSPENWEKPLGSADVHVVVTALAPDAENLEAALKRARRRYQELPGVTAIWRQDCHVLPDEKEALGFKDGISSNENDYQRAPRRANSGSWVWL